MIVVKTGETVYLGVWQNRELVSWGLELNLGCWDHDRASRGGGGGPGTRAGYVACIGLDNLGSLADESVG